MTSTFQGIGKRGRILPTSEAFGVKRLRATRFCANVVLKKNLDYQKSYVHVDFSRMRLENVTGRLDFDPQQMTPITYALEHGYALSEVASLYQELRENGKSTQGILLSRDPRGKLPLQLASGAGNRDIFEFFLEEIKRDKVDCRQPRRGVRRRSENKTVEEKFLKNINIPVTCFSRLSKVGLRELEALFESKSFPGRWPLVGAVSKNYKEALAFLLQEADLLGIDTKGHDAVCAFTQALRMGNCHIAARLFHAIEPEYTGLWLGEHKFAYISLDLHASQSTLEQQFSFFAEVLENLPEEDRFLLLKNLLFFAIMLRVPSSVLEVFLKIYRVDFQALKNADDLTLLEYAALLGNEEAFIYLLPMFKDVDFSVVRHAVQGRNANILFCLERANITIPWEQEISGFGSLLHMAISLCDRETFEFLLQKISFDVVNSEQQTILHAVAMSGDIAIAEVILEYLNEKGLLFNWLDLMDEYYRMPLHYAALEGNTEVLDLLINCGASPNLPDDQGNKPLDLILGVKFSEDNQRAVDLLAQQTEKAYNFEDLLDVRNAISQVLL